MGMQGPIGTGGLRLPMPISHCCLSANFVGLNITLYPLIADLVCVMATEAIC